MRFSARAAITAALAVPAVAALILTGAGTASAATTVHSSGPFNPFCGQLPLQGQYGNQNQFPFQQGQWNLSGSNTVKVSFEVNTYDYAVSFTQQGSCLSGWLTDPGASFTGRVHGTISGNFITFSVTYPAGSKQGTRTFNGTINGSGYVSGSWSETGSEVGSGSWSLTNPAYQNCQVNFQFNRHNRNNRHHNYNQGCYFPYGQP
jgi:hypothetical protein